VKFIIDAQLPPYLADLLRQRGLEVEAVREIGLRHAKDRVIWEYALSNDGAIMTKDSDFAERCIRAQNAPVVIWLRIGNVSNVELYDWLLPWVPAIVARINAGDRLIEVR
jgi:predicted nuclease of predicted toxin-antitoxin system